MDNNKPQHLSRTSASGTALSLDALYRIAPQVFTEVADPQTGRPTRKVCFTALRRLLGDDTVEDPTEAYQFTWVGKAAAKAEAARPTSKTLRPCKEESRQWDTTKNLYIEGDNLEVLKLLQRAYLGKVKMIYIDPPYNTGNDFVYHDDFHRSRAEEELAAGDIDEQGLRYRKNTETNGQYHSDWCSMIYARLLVARSLLTEDGVIFISIDDNEVENLRKICDEVFGEVNKIAQLIIENNPRGRQSDTFFATSHEYLLCYAKNIDSASIKGKPLTDEQKADYKYNDEIGQYRLLGLRQRGVASLRTDRPEMFFPFWVNPIDGNISLDPVDGWSYVIPKKSDGREGRWMWGKQKCKTDYNRLVAKLISTRNEYDIFVKDYLNNKEGQRTRKYKTIWSDKNLNNQIGTQEVKGLLGGDYMSFPKSSSYIKSIIQVGSDSDSIVIDFFSGSATTAHAVMQLNAEDGGNRKFIMVQLPEETAEDSEAFKAGYKNICEIGKERIRRAGDKIRADSPLTTQDLDTGFRVLKLDSSNFEEVERAPKDFTQESLSLFANNIKGDRDGLDQLFGAMLSWGVTLDLPMQTDVVDGCEIYTVNEGDLVACFSEGITDRVVEAMVAKAPLRVLFRDSCFTHDDQKINIYEKFKQRLDWTDDEAFKNIRVI